ncbi:hypothetical protein C7416_102238 [Cupriavidus phytorum]|uniref:Uncharacterized protein n=1 Tax=Cupriavidus phytorum TaxID=3024399 RepID=A0A2W7P7Q6_9BURK|nr:hypothetical protein [Cupriavidus alkaliphilus]PZX32078.1 hypothetical protein C7416_102238 [Cupriavidus alkaliphilus]
MQKTISFNPSLTPCLVGLGFSIDGVDNGNGSAYFCRDFHFAFFIWNCCLTLRNFNVPKSKPTRHHQFLGMILMWVTDSSFVAFAIMGHELAYETYSAYGRIKAWRDGRL